MANAILANLETPSKDLIFFFTCGALGSEGGWGGGGWDSPTWKIVSPTIEK